MASVRGVGLFARNYAFLLLSCAQPRETKREEKRKSADGWTTVGRGRASTKQKTISDKIGQGAFIENYSSRASCPRK